MSTVSTIKKGISRKDGGRIYVTLVAIIHSGHIPLLTIIAFGIFWSVYQIFSIHDVFEIVQNCAEILIFFLDIKIGLHSS